MYCWNFIFNDYPGKRYYITCIPITTLLAVLWGIALGAIGSSTGDVHITVLKVNIKFHRIDEELWLFKGDIVANVLPMGAKNSMDVVNFCAKFGGPPLTGFCFGLVVFFSFWNTVVLNL